MTSYGSSDEHQPLTWVRGHPVYAAHAIVAAYVVSMLVTTVMLATNARDLLEWLPFSSSAVLTGQVWRVFTYGFYNPPGLWFAIDMVMIVWFGREVEKVYGRNKFLTLFALLYLAPPLALTLVGLKMPTVLVGEAGGFGLFIAFATIYPNVSFFFGILARWLAIILVALYSLIALSQRDLASLISLWATSALAFAFVRQQQGRIEWPSFRRAPDSVPEKRPGTTSRPASSARSDSMAEIDALLDKIAASGIHSLTPKERAKLDAAHAEMKNRTSSR